MATPPWLKSTARLFQGETASGALLFVAALAAMTLANSPLSIAYSAFLDLPVEVRVGGFQIAKPLLLWINDGLMAIFFFLVGLEIKREILEGELSSPAKIALPALAAAGGMLVPGLIYALVNAQDTTALRGWAIPCATDIAFALGVLSLFGSRVPAGLKLFLLTLAILDDLGAIVIIAVFYTDNLSPMMLSGAGAIALILLLMNWRGVALASPYLLLGVVMWAMVLKSGVHATLAGIVIAFLMPLRLPAGSSGTAPARRLERDLHAVVSLAILPLFAFANAGVPLAGLSASVLANSVPMGIALGLIAGKVLGVSAAVAIAVSLHKAELPGGSTWPQFIGLSFLCGIGFTMSLFIAALAFEGEAAHLAVESRLGILLGSSLSGIAGAWILHRTLPRSRNASGASIT